MPSQTKLTQETIAEKTAKIDDLKRVLTLAETKLRIYRAHSNGQYHGGPEYRMLMKEIAKVLAP